MADPAKMQPTGADVESFIEAIPNANRRAGTTAGQGLGGWLLGVVNIGTK